MRLKAPEGPLAVHNQHNQNNDNFNSPKRINTLQNSRYITNNLRIKCSAALVEGLNTNAENCLNYSTNFYDNTNTSSLSLNNFFHNTNSADLTSNFIPESNNGVNEDSQRFYGYDIENLTETLRVDGVDNDLQWCNTTGLIHPREEQQPINTTHDRICQSKTRNINNSNLAAQLRIRVQPEYCPEPPSPDDVLIRDDLDDQQSCSSSVSASPDAETRDIDAESSDEGQVETVTSRKLQPQNIRCIVNPNYPGFQHLAHTLIEGYTEDNVTAALEIDNNANNNISEEVIKIDKIDSVNRLDSIENIQKIFHDKTVLNIHPIELGDSPSSIAHELVDSTTSIDQSTLVDSTTSIEQDIDNNIDESTLCIDEVNNIENGDEEFSARLDESDDKAEDIADDDADLNHVHKLKSLEDSKFDDKNIESVLGSLSKEIEVELDRFGLSAEQFDDQLRELELVADKLKTIADPSPSVLQKYFEPNSSEPFEIHRQNDISESKILPSEYQDPVVDKPRQEFDSTENYNILDSTSKKLANQECLIKKKEVVRPSTLDLPSRHIKRPLENVDFCFDDESDAEDLKAEQLIMSAKLIDITRTPTFASSNSTKDSYDGTDLDMTNKMVDAALSNAKENVPGVTIFKDVKNMEKKEKKREWVKYKDMKKGLQDAKNKSSVNKTGSRSDADIGVEKLTKEDLTKNIKEKDTNTSSLSKKAKFSNYIRRRIDYSQQFGSLITFPRRENVLNNRDPLNRRSVPVVKKRGSHSEALEEFDVYNIETAMPKIDMEAIESHLKAAKDEERRRRTDREEIRRRLAMGSEDDYYTDRPGRKPSLQSRLQSGMNLQICFMNETVSDTDSPTSDSESPVANPKQPKFNQNLTNNVNSRNFEKDRPVAQRPATLLIQPQPSPNIHSISTSDADFFTKQARLQTEARMALAQAKEMARMQMEIEKQRQKKSPITEMIRSSLEKVGIPFPEEKRRLSRQILTEMNVAQLQVIVNDLHTQIETLNENLVKFLMDRDDLHMEQDSMLVDIEDLTRYLGAKEHVLKDSSLPTPRNNNFPPPSPAPPSPLQTALNNTVRPHLTRIASLVKK